MAYTLTFTVAVLWYGQPFVTRAFPFRPKVLELLKSANSIEIYWWEWFLEKVTTRFKTENYRNSVIFFNRFLPALHLGTTPFFGLNLFTEE